MSHFQETKPTGIKILSTLRYFIALKINNDAFNWVIGYEHVQYVEINGLFIQANKQSTM